MRERETYLCYCSPTLLYWLVLLSTWVATLNQDLLNCWKCIGVLAAMMSMSYFDMVQMLTMSLVYRRLLCY